MVSNILILFFTAFLGGLIPLWFRKIQIQQYKLTLVFAGAYLFGITVVHLLPEVFHGPANATLIGAFVLGGFFLQQFLEHLTTGIEHGHMHTHNQHGIKPRSGFLLMAGLTLHAFLEGTILVHPHPGHAHDHETSALLLGIVLHKTPAAFALMTVLLHDSKSIRVPVILLIIFCLASPLGLLAGELLIHNAWLDEAAFTLLFALVCGNFLHISTTIVFESNLDHKFNLKKLIISVLGAGVAVLAELFL